MTTASQSVDYSSSTKKIRQQLMASELGISSVPFEQKRSSRPVQQTKKSSPVPVKATSVDPSINDIRRRHAEEVSSLRSEALSMRSSISESRKDLHGRFSLVDQNIDSLKKRLDTIQIESKSAPVDKTVSTQLSQLYTYIKNLESQIKSAPVHEKTVIVKEPVQQVQRSPDVDVQIKQLNAAVKDMAMKLNALTQKEPVVQVISDQTEHLHVGKRFNLPEQPEIEREGGIHKVAPLALTINGAVILHDIGYTTDKKGLVPLYYDPVSQRALIYHGK